MLQLPDVTLVMIETREHALAAAAMEECCAKAKFGDVLICTNDLEPFDGIDFDHCVSVPDWPDKMGWSRFLWNEVAQYVRTTHMLSIQWDSWIVNPEAWRDEFLQYDYIGAPWWYKDGMNVGNGGFSLRSTALMRYLRKHRDRYPCVNAIDDDQLCRKYRPLLMDVGFKWAPEDLAFKFAFECVPAPDLRAKPFGFHAMFNWPKVLEPEALEARIKLAAKSKYIRGSYIWKSLVKEFPEAERIANG